jgi:hypothetical protein
MNSTAIGYPDSSFQKERILLISNTLPFGNERGRNATYLVVLGKNQRLLSRTHHFPSLTNADFKETTAGWGMEGAFCPPRRQRKAVSSHSTHSEGDARSLSLPMLCYSLNFVGKQRSKQTNRAPTAIHFAKRISPPKCMLRCGIRVTFGPPTSSGLFGVGFAGFI